MRNILYLISNEKIFQNNEMFFCDNLDMKSTPEGLNKHFDVKVIARKSKVSRLQKLNLKTVKTFVGSYYTLDSTGRYCDGMEMVTFGSDLDS